MVIAKVPPDCCIGLFFLLQSLGYGKITGTSYLVENIEPDVEYEFRVSAENDIGTSEPSTSGPVKYGKSIFTEQTHYSFIECVTFVSTTFHR